MKTDISDFCQEFSQSLIPVREALGETLEIIQTNGDSDTLQLATAGLSDVHHRLESLVNKVEEQQAYVIIFGPLKSGKSTLMNAISASYVSQVTSLPAYPCVVHVKHGESSGYQVTHYNGEKRTFSDNASLQNTIRDNYESLAEKIRGIEEQGEDFDPGVHFPEAIRRVDVEVPAPNLKDSLAVLVDTPGLYTRMKFGYDLMTREFRSSAASAVFVVKTDNLFFEQVFDEFNELLDLFSRIFLVVNIDSTKQDLEPDGSFQPSLESQSPEEVIKAFEALAMRAPLRKAAEEGRLRIYPVDLLNAASNAIKQYATPADGEGLTDSEENPPEAMDETGSAAVEDPESRAEGTDENQNELPAASATESFSSLLRDLTDYLNSNDYLSEFMGDSLHQGKILADEITAHCRDEAMEGFIKHLKALRGELAEASEQSTALQKFSEVDWNQTFDSIRTENREALEGFSTELRKEMENKATQELEKWFDTESSASVLKEQLNALMKETEAMIESESSRRGTSLVEGSLGGMRLDEALLPYLNRVQSFIHPAIEKGRTSLNEAEISVPSCQMDVSESWFKVKKGFWDWILFRSSNGLRRKLLGSSEALEKAVTPAVKKRRMGDDAREFIQEKVIAHLDSILPVAPAAVAERMLSHYVETVQSELREGIEAGIQEQKERQSDLEKRIEQNQEIRRRIEQLVAQGGVLLEGIPLLQEKYNAVNWEDRQGDNNSDSEEREGDSTESKDASVSNEASSGFSEDDLEGF